MRATESTRGVGLESGDAQTTAAQTHFDSRDRLAGRLDDSTVRQAVEEPASRAATPTPRTPETTERRLK